MQHVAVDQAGKYHEEIAEVGVQVEVLDGLGHYQEFTDVDRVLLVIQRFLNR